MSFSYTFKTLRSGNTYDSNARLEMSAHEEEFGEEMKADASERNDENSVTFSPDMVNEKNNACLEPLQAQISALMEMTNRLIQGNWAREFATANTRRLWHQYELHSTGALGTSRFAHVAVLNTARYSHDNDVCWKLQGSLL